MNAEKKQTRKSNCGDCYKDISSRKRNERARIVVVGLTKKRNIHNLMN